MCVCGYGGQQRSTVGMFLSSSLPLLLRQGLSLNAELTDLASLLSMVALKSVRLYCLPNAGILNAQTPSQH